MRGAILGGVWFALNAAGTSVLTTRLQPQQTQRATTLEKPLAGGSRLQLFGERLKNARLPPPTENLHTRHDLDLAVTPYGPEPRDRGGWLLKYKIKIEMMNLFGEPMRMAGTCVSACTMYLGVKNVCVEPDAMLWFHAANESGRISPEGNEAMRRMWPRTVQHWADRSGALALTTFTRRRALSGKELIAMGLRRCG